MPSPRPPTGVGVASQAARRRTLKVSAILSMVTPHGWEGGKGEERICTALLLDDSNGS